MPLKQPKWPRRIEPAQPGDIPLVMDSWQRSFSRSRHAGVVPNNLWVDTMRSLVTGLLARGAKILVARNPDDAWQVLGWICFEADEHKRAVHYLFVKDPWRRDGIASELLAAALGEPGRAFVTCANDTEGADLFRMTMVQRGWRFAHEPAIARRKDF